MWVYQEPQTLEAIAAPAAAAPLPPEKPAERPAAPPMQKQKPAAQRPARAQHGTGASARSCIPLAAAYLLGTAAAGALQALCDTAQLDALRYYLRCWCALFALSGARSIVQLFCTEYIAAATVATALLLLGLSAFGPVPLYFFMMLYGTGTGLLAAQLFEGITPKIFAAYLLIAGLPAAVYAVCVCMLGASAAQVCCRLQRFSFSSRGGPEGGAGAQSLMGKYFLTMALFLPLSGAATGLVYLANLLHLW